MAFGTTASSATPAETCMSLAVSLLSGPQGQSFEEVRIADYLTSYRATGRPPQPCPPYPTDPAQRAAQSLPPLFAPAPFPSDPSSSNPITNTNTISPFGAAPSAASSLFGSGSTFGATPAGANLGGGGGIFGGSGGGGTSGGLTAGATPTATAAAITDPARLPIPQTLAGPVPVASAEREREAFASIVAAPEFVGWSHEELRYHAYLRGARAPPQGTPMFPFDVGAPLSGSGRTGTSTLFSNLLNPVANNPFANTPAPQDASGDQFQSITARPEFAGHSVEELRVSFLRTGAELTSAQIFAGATSASGTTGTAAPTAPSTNNAFLAPPAAAPAQNAFAAARPPISPFAPQPQQPQPAPQAVSSFSFGGGAPAAQPQGLFATQQAQAQPAASSNLFGGASVPPAQQSIFGGALQPPQPTAAPQFSFGATPTPSGSGGTGFAFGARRGF